MKTLSNATALCASALIAICAACGGADFTSVPSASELAQDSGTADPPDSGVGSSDGATGGGDSGSDSGQAGGDAGPDSGLPDSGGGDAGQGGPDSGADGGDAGCAHTVCLGSCVDTSTDPANCGACGYAAVNGRTCVGGKPSPAWQSISSVGAPPARTRHAAAFLSPSFIVTGGSATQFGVGTSDVGYYDPSTNAWTAGNPLATARCSHGQVASSLRSYVFGGLSDCADGGTVGPGSESYNPGTGHWTGFAVAGQPALRYNFATTWIEPDQKMFVFGGSNVSPSLSSGALFYPVGGGAWSDATCGLAGCDRSGFVGAFKDAGSIKVWGGNGSPGGLQYALATGVWSAWALPAGTPSPMPQRYADSGTRIFYLQSSGACPGTVTVLSYDRASAAWASPDSSAVPAGLVAEAATAWTGSELVAWSGACGSGAPTSVGGRYQPPAP